MKILLINKFLYPSGGDAVCTLRTGKLLSDKGHDVSYWGMSHPDNEEFPLSRYFIETVNYAQRVSFFKNIRLSSNIIFSFEARKNISQLLKTGFRPDLVHLHNFAHQISPSVLGVFKQHGIPMVMTMHDYKMVCPVYVLLRERKACELCKNGRYYHCLIHRCSKGSFLQSAINTLEMYLHHKICNLYSSIGLFIAPSFFLKSKVEELGFKRPVHQLYNFFDTAAMPSPDYGNGDYILYFGRISPEKGLLTLLKAIKGTGIPLKIAGKGPFESEINKFIELESVNEAKMVGFQTGQALSDLIKGCRITVLPSECYENNPGSIIEAFSFGKPAIGSRVGGIPELVIDNITGLTYESGNSYDLRDKMSFLFNQPDAIIAMGRNARKFVEEEFSSDKHYEKLMNLYKIAQNGIHPNEQSAQHITSTR